LGIINSFLLIEKKLECMSGRDWPDHGHGVVYELCNGFYKFEVCSLEIYVD